MKFIDLFAGLGGFHLALTRLGHDCVFASEIDTNLSEVYKQNFGFMPVGDIRGIELEDIPSHDILCAGFPCQPFSKAGGQKGFEDPDSGDLFSYVIKIVHFHKPRYIILENVPNIERHNNGTTWEKIYAELKNEGYYVKFNKLSPHHFGIPQIRDRIFIVGSLNDLSYFQWPSRNSDLDTSIVPFLDNQPNDAKKLTKQVEDCLNVWQEFISLYPKNEEILSPIWSMEFGASYPFEDKTPYAIGYENLSSFYGNHGTPLKDFCRDEIMSALPSYAKREESRFPHWKRKFIRDSRELYKNNKNWIDDWLPKVLEFPPSLQKLEWNIRGGERDIWKHIIQIRASGVRVKKKNTSPSLVAMTTTQVPIVAWEKRYMTPRECAKLQSLGDLRQLPEAPTRAFKALGNAVNADIVEKICKVLIK